MAVELAKGTPLDSCERCGNDTLPITRIVITDEERFTIPLCVLCLAEGIDIPTGWNNVANVLTWLGRSDAAARFRNPLNQTKRARHRKLAPAATRRPKFEQQELPNE